MKKLLMLVAVLAVMIACKKKEEKPTETKKEETVKTIKEEPKVDYASYGMQDADAPKGLAKGSKAPSVDLVIDGKKTALVDVYKDQKVALIFYRGHWCPSCNKHLSTFAQRAKELEDKGVKLIAIAPEASEGVLRTKDKTKATFTIVSDVDGSIQKAFDVDYKVTDDYVNMVDEKLQVSIPENNANGQAQLPVPATYVINEQGEIIFVHFDPNYSNRASVDDILSAI